METLELSASQAAEQAYRNLKSKVRFVPKQKIEPKKKKHYKLLFLLVFFPAFAFLYPSNYYKVEGNIHINGSFAENTNIFFYNKQNKEIVSVESGKDGNFTIWLKKGYYKIFFKEIYKNPETSPFSLKMSRNLKNLKIYIPKISNKKTI